MGKLIRLELFNFKSYKGHHTLLFGDSYFTSIIGPNGSGKSNSMDAISFVLGIKSTHLRSSHLKDLVYRGRVLKTSKINDDGSAAAPASNGHANGDGDVSDGESQSQRPGRNDPKTAWVMAVYEDDAGDEQKWKRSITNQGASEYRINDRVVTSAQYNESLEAENILIKARNFLVFQGDVEAIASQSPKDLTRLIEQISGSLEYKAEYERLQAESEQAQENQNYNLHRRRGINSEIKQYQEQKKEAEAFQNKADQRDDAIVTHILWKLYHFQRVMEESTASIQEHQENLKEFRRGVEKYEKTLEEAQLSQSAASKNVSKAERNIKRQEKEIDAKENSLVPINEKIDIETKKIERIQQKATQVAKERAARANELEAHKKQYTTVEKAQRNFDVQWQETMKNQGTQLSEDDFKEYNKLRSEVISKTSSNQSKLEHLTRQVKTDGVTVNSLKGKVEASESSIEKLEGEIGALKERRDATKLSVKEISQDIDSKKKEFNSIQSERVRVNQLHTEKDEKLQAILQQLTQAQAGVRQNDKERRTKEMVISLKRLYPGVRGRLSEFCKPKQKRFEEAVIIALSRDFDSVIVDTDKTGIECVSYLKEQHFGPMTFIPLDNIKVTNVDSSLKSLHKARLTIDTIDFDPSLERAMAYAAGNSIVCDDLDTAKDICFRKKIRVKAVTLEGYVINKGLMTGGRTEQSSKRKFEDGDIPNLEAQAQKYRSDLEALPKVGRRGVIEETLQSELTGLQQRLLYVKSELTAFEQNLASKKKELAHEERQWNEMKPRYEEKQAAMERIQENVQEFEDAISKVQDKIYFDFCKRLGYANIRAYEAQQGTLEQESAEKKNGFEIQKKKLDNQIKWLESTLKGVDLRAATMEAEIQNLQKDIENYTSQKTKLEDEIEEDKNKETELQDELHKQKEKLAAKNEAVNKARAELHKRSKDIDIRNKAIATLEADLQRNNAGRYALLRRCKLDRIALPLTEESEPLDALPDDHLLQADPDAMDVDEGDAPVEDLANDYGIEINFDEFDDDLKKPDEEDMDEHLQQRIKSLSDELEKLNPNMRAIDRLDDVETRLKATEKDYEDARKSAKKTKEAFDDVKTKRFEVFNKAFQHISEQIIHVYKDLTRSSAYPAGGQAYLDIEDSETPYLAGIKYHAMPPLKRFRDMEHLSGGEKTMAALALLFAVHSYQPSPFFVLDEVDAALDNANVEKIKNYIREHAAPGMQFIVISLKPGLFQGSESLVGVFRDQDANSSKTLTLDLRKYV